MSIPRVFVSHSHQDNPYCREFVAVLRQGLGDADAVWYDEHNLGWGALRPTIERELSQRQHFIAILSPAAVASDWVNTEIDAALELLREQRMQTILFVLAAPCEVPLTLRRYKRIERANGVPYPASEAAARALPIITSVPGAQPDTPMLPPLSPIEPMLPSPAPMPQGAQPITPGFLNSLGFRVWQISGVECILPPICPVPDGIFLMGSDRSRDEQASRNETPQCSIEVGDYSIGQHPVTVAEYACAVRAGAVPEPPRTGAVDWQIQLERLNSPVVCVTWHNALAYTRWLAKATSQPWRLPTEPEWEKAARGTDGRIYPWGDAFDLDRCNTRESSSGTATPVGRYPTGASPCGAQDMAGNVWEWVSSLYQLYPYVQDGGQEDLRATGQRMQRGGSWGSGSGSARAAFRSHDAPDNIYSSVGFRLAMSAPAGT